ncbi:deoxynucleoside kinase [Salinicoccus kekensis]|uniref:Deoxyadenosine/deoxycytidine kinase n=1 Tax=Salinicoccus kekensis TaxID=714307 RepID=A0A285US16_9STAP|nr:deoxynucleoside kinase [Salinicoccus kekensis]SOC44573.1 deoxyadenosine/deoxycytidine kinase [Salinicoccus kekensis]
MITMAGTIGAGKTAWGGVIARHFGTELLIEKVEGNPFLPKFYEDPKRYSFHLQVYFLNHRFKALKNALKHPNTVLDRSIYEDAMVFARLQYDNGSMDEAEYMTYLELHENMMQELHDLYEQQIVFKKSPDLLVFVHGSFDEAMRRIRKRGRPYEQVERDPGLAEYYRDLYDIYENEFIKEYEKKEISPVYHLDIDKYEVSDPRDVETVLGEIESMLKKERGFVFPEME